MLELRLFREEKEKIIQGLKKKNLIAAEKMVDEVLMLDEKRRSIQLSMDQTLALVNQKAKEIGTAIREGKNAETLKAETAELKTASKKLSEELERYETELHALLTAIPNVPHESVPEGKTAEDNEIVLQNGDLPVLPDDALPHWELIRKYDIIDFELGNKITGAGFPVYKGKGARLQRALINFFLDEALKVGYTEIQPPIFINKESGFGTGQLPDKEGQMYHIAEDDLYAIPTAEVPITNLYRDTILSEDILPIKNVGYTPCFRREAGSWGAHVRGLNRLHQFDKVEIVQITAPESSYDVLEEMSSYVQGLLRKLELPYRVAKLCGGDISFNSALTYDMEVYSGAQKRWLEVSSVSNFETFQANRLKLRTKDREGKNRLLHTLNGSALALPRIVAALVENNQTDQGIKIPPVLHDYTGFDLIR